MLSFMYQVEVPNDQVKFYDFKIGNKFEFERAFHDN